MFNRIRHHVSHTEGWCAPMSRRHRSLMPVGPGVAPHGHFAHNWFATAEVL